MRLFMQSGQNIFSRGYKDLKETISKGDGSCSINQNGVQLGKEGVYSCK